MVWLIAEAERATGVAGGGDWSKRGELDVTLLNRAGELVAAERVALLPGAFGTRVTFKPSALLTPGEYQLQVRGRSAAGAVTSATLDESWSPRLPAQPARCSRAEA